jgi:hypothetical protein
MPSLMNVVTILGQVCRNSGLVGRTVLDCTGFRQTDAAEFPVSTWIRLTVDETTAVVFVQRTRLPTEEQ